ncbi:MAG TPA: efflux transporter outer membrane subunit [Rhizomicrobium sp.]|nr:efflux transporter outer membrane subunit [Rhizomicrobium sp.]
MKRAAALPLLSALLVSACTVGPDFKAPTPPSISTYAAKGDAPAPDDQRVALGKEIEGNWWAGFQSPSLDGVITLALAGNEDAEAAKERMAEAEEEVNAAEGALLPQVSLGGTAGYQKYGHALFGPLNFNIPAFAYYTLGPTVTFPLDIFGGQKRAVEQRKALLEYQHFELDAAYQSLVAHVAAEALALASARAELDTLNAIIADDQRNVDLVQSAINAGSGTRVQLLTAQTQLVEDRALLPDLKQREAVARHALAVLVGKAPAEWSPPEFALNDFTLPSELPVSLPSELVHRRPDIQAAEAQLHAASAAIGVATANLYPNFNLTATVTQQALNPGELFNRISNAYSLAANLTQPLFNGGRLNAEKRAAIDNYKAMLALYRQTMIGAFSDVADRLQALANDADRLHAQEQAAQTAAESLDLARKSFQAGNSGILDVIDAERRNAQAQLSFTRAKSQRLMDTTELYLSLGGSPITPPASDVPPDPEGQ